MSSLQPGTQKDLGCKEGGYGGREDNLYKVKSERLTSLLNEINLKVMLRKLIWWIMKNIKNAPGKCRLKEYQSYHTNFAPYPVTLVIIWEKIQKARLCLYSG